ncbi:MAG: Asp23/Gls24 family envelope stress response protein [Victivallales bacterium]|nr:Asp23/Gls24 family envelope stress response protein [Victivallales bacterium]
MALVLRFGCNVPTVAKEIKEILFDKIPALTGYPVTKVNVNVVDLEDEEEIEDESAEQ